MSSRARLSKTLRRKRIREFLLRAQLGLCALCHGKMENPDEISADHIFPKSYRFKTEKNKLRLLTHKSCNGARGNGAPTQRYFERANALHFLYRIQGYRTHTK